MGEDNFKPDCDNIKRNIKSFMDDMLREDEYKAFLHHLEICGECKSYVRSVDSFSNQLWRLGDVKVPSDFGSTVLFKLTQPEEEPEGEETSTKSKKWLIGGVVFILVAMTVAAGLISYIKLRQPSEEEAGVAQVSEMFEEVVGEYSGEPEDDTIYDDSDATFEGVDESIAFEWTGDAVEVEATTATEVSLGPKLIHWHFLHYNKTKELAAMRLRRLKRKRESDLKRSIKEKEQLDVDSELAKKKDSDIKGFEEEIRQIEVQLEQNLAEKNRREGGPLNILKSLDIMPNYQDNDFVLFAVSGDGLKNVLDAMALISQNSSSLDDFTPGASHLPHKNYQVSVYMVKKETTILHWHVRLAMMNQKLQLLKTIQENGGVITYEFAEEVTISIASSKIEAIKTQMPAMRISLSEYGNQVELGEESANKSTVISIYFSK